MIRDRSGGTMRRAALLATVLGALTALAGCGSSGSGLLPASHAQPLLADFEAVRDAAEKGAGDCAATEAALTKTQSDFAALPRSVNAALRANLEEGIENLALLAHEACAKQAGATGPTGTTGTTGTTKTTPPPSTGTTGTTPPSTEEGEAEEGAANGSGGAKTPEPKGPGAEEKPNPGGAESPNGVAGAPEGH
jgi:hypothetical protein